MRAVRSRTDRCPGALRPWAADDGLLVRLRLIGGRVRSGRLLSLLEVAESYADGRIHLTSRANVQVRGFRGCENRLSAAALTALERTGLLPTRTHELVRNVMVSPQTGLAGGRADVRGVAERLDRLLCTNDRLARLPGRFLFVLDDGRGDLLTRKCDLGFVALDPDTVQLRVGGHWGPAIDLRDAAPQIVGLADRFLQVRGQGPAAAWHVSELGCPLIEPHEPDGRLPVPSVPLAYGDVPGGQHIAVPSTGLDRRGVSALLRDATEVVVTPWRGVLVPEEKPRV